MNQKLTFEYIHSICSIRMERHKWMNAVSADVNDFRLIHLDTIRVLREEVWLPSIDVVNCLFKQLSICFGEDTWESSN